MALSEHNQVKIWLGIGNLNGPPQLICFFKLHKPGGGEAKSWYKLQFLKETRVSDFRILTKLCFYAALISKQNGV